MNGIDDKKISRVDRLITMLVDHGIMSAISVVFALPMIVALISGITKTMRSGENHFPGADLMTGPFLYIYCVAFAVYFCKDIVNGRSFAKRLLKYQVVNNKTGQVASPFQCFIRNIFCLVWPIEVVAAMINTNRRIGDYVAGTRLVRYDAALEQPKINLVKLAIPLILAYGLSISFAMFTTSIPSLFKFHNKVFKDASYNTTKSRELEKLLTDSMHRDIVVRASVYDTVYHYDLKYVKIRMRLNNNYLYDEDTYLQMSDRTEKLVYSIFPKETITGTVQYTYDKKSTYKNKLDTIGMPISPNEKK